MSVGSLVAENDDTVVGGVSSLAEKGLQTSECGVAAERDLVCGKSQSLWHGPWWQGWWRLGGRSGTGVLFLFLLLFAFFFILLETF